MSFCLWEGASVSPLIQEITSEEINYEGNIIFLSLNTIC